MNIVISLSLIIKLKVINAFSQQLFAFPNFHISNPWIFKDPMTTAAAIDRVVHHSIIVEFGKDISSHHAQEAAQRIQEETNK